MANQKAPPGMVWVCAACGKRSRDQYGFDKIDAGFDESCMLHGVLCLEEKNADGNWVLAEDVKEIQDRFTDASKSGLS